MKVLAVRRADRFAGAAFAIAVQAALLVLLLSSRPLLAPIAPVVRELTLILPRLRDIEPAPARPNREPRPQSAPLSVTPGLPGATRLAPASPDLGRLGQSLFGCAPENYASLTPAQRALCARPGDGVAVRQAPNLMGLPSQSKDEAHWAFEWQRKETPLLAPGADAHSVIPHITLFATGSRPSLLDGCGGDCPLYEIAAPAPEDFYQHEQDDAAWNKAHGGK